MPKYEVTLRDINVYIIEVDSHDSDSAIQKAWDTVFENEYSKIKYYHDSDGESEACEIQRR